MTHHMIQQFIIHHKHITIKIYSPKSIPKTYMKQIAAILYLLVPYSQESCTRIIYSNLFNTI